MKENGIHDIRPDAVRSRTCCFTGHRNLPRAEVPAIRERLREVIASMVRMGVCYFGAGGARGFDTLAAETVLELESQFPELRLILVLPCRDQTRSWRKEDVARYEAVKVQADKVVYTAEHYYTGCMQVRNRRLVDCSGRCIAYLTERSGGTWNTVLYCQGQGVPVTNIALLR